MPHEGFTSVTISNFVFDKIKQNYSENKEELVMMGITSISNYTVFMIGKFFKNQEGIVCPHCKKKVMIHG